MIDKTQKKKILEELGGIDEACYDELVKEFIVLADKMILEAEKLLREDNLDGVSKTAHSIKGSSGNLRINTIYEIAKLFETVAYEKKDKKEVAAAFEKLVLELSDFKKGFEI